MFIFTLCSLLQTVVELPACVGAFATTANERHFLWRGNDPGEEAPTIRIFHPTNEEWTLQPTTGTPPPGLYDGGCTSIGEDLYCFGGGNGYSHFNDLYKLNLQNFQWSRVHPRNDQTYWPMPKINCGFVAIDERTLCCYGGYNHNTKQTNEFHLFYVKEGTYFISISYIHLVKCV